MILGVAIAACLELLVWRTRFGAQLRAAVDNPTAARGLGINVGRVFTLAFALGSGLAGLGGALGVEVLGLDPGFPVLILGVADVAGKYYVPQVGAFVIYAVMVAMLIFRPEGLFGRRVAC